PTYMTLSTSRNSAVPSSPRSSAVIFMLIAMSGLTCIDASASTRPCSGTLPVMVYRKDVRSSLLFAALATAATGDMEGDSEPLEQPTAPAASTSAARPAAGTDDLMNPPRIRVPRLQLPPGNT